VEIRLLIVCAVKLCPCCTLNSSNECSTTPLLDNGPDTDCLWQIVEAQCHRVALYDLQDNAPWPW
jgi:hypothetical protein